jgi:predicted DNA-binding antitoxin AbrB/MazE fold protein
MKQYLLFILFCLLTLANYAQDDRVIQREQKPPQDEMREDMEMTPQLQEVPNTPPPKNQTRTTEVPPQEKVSKEKEKPKGKYLEALNRKNKKTIDFVEGEKVIVILKKDDEKIKGRIKGFGKKTVIIKDREIELQDLAMMKKPFIKSFTEKSVGLSKFGIGSGLVVVGGGVVYLAFGILNLSSPIVVLTAVGVVVGLGVSSFGIAVMNDGIKDMLEGTKADFKAGWVPTLKGG